MFVCVAGPHRAYTTPVMMWAWGFISPQVLQHTMKLFKQDLSNKHNNKNNKQKTTERTTIFKKDLAAATTGGGLDMKLVNDIAGIGADGESPQNMHRDLVRNMYSPQMPKLTVFEVPVSHKVLGSWDVDTDIILPHELFAALFCNFREAFHLYLCPSEALLDSFWSAVSGGCKKLYPVFEFAIHVQVYLLCL